MVVRCAAEAALMKNPERHIRICHPLKIVMFCDLAKVPYVVQVGLDRVASAAHVEDSFDGWTDDAVMLWSHEAKNDRHELDGLEHVEQRHDETLLLLRKTP